MRQLTVIKALLWDQTRDLYTVTLKDVLSACGDSFCSMKEASDYMKEIDYRCERWRLMPVFISPCQDSKYFGKEMNEKLEEYLRFHYKSLRVVDMMEEYKKAKGYDDVQAFKENWAVNMLWNVWYALACYDAYTYWYDVCGLKWSKVTIVDLNGTTISNKARFKKFFNKDTGKFDYDGYNRDDQVYLLDHPIIEMQEKISELNADWYRVVIITGRPAQVLYGSLARIHFSYDGLFMRENGDHSPSNGYKERMLKSILPFLDLSKTIVYDDRKKDIDMYEKHGLFVVNCGWEDNDF